MERQLIKRAFELCYVNSTWTFKVILILLLQVKYTQNIFNLNRLRVYLSYPVMAGSWHNSMLTLWVLSSSLVIATLSGASLSAIALRSSSMFFSISKISAIVCNNQRHNTLCLICSIYIHTVKAIQGIIVINYRRTIIPWYYCIYL